jgi:hypothetical protein
MENMLNYPHLYRPDMICHQSATTYIKAEEIEGNRALLSSISASKIVDDLIAKNSYD